MSILLFACTGQSQQKTAQPPAVSPSAVALTNPTDFPLAPGSKVLDVKPFEQTITQSEAHNSLLGGKGAGTYAGHEVLAASTMPDDGLRAWLADVGKKPPSGYSYATGSAGATGGTARTLDQYGVAYAAFRGGSSGDRGVVVVVMDPKIVKSKLGFALDLLDQYRSLPAALRDPIDAQFKAKTGMTVTEATDPSSPLGMTLGALRELQNSDERAIVMIDGTKKHM